MIGLIVSLILYLILFMIAVPEGYFLIGLAFSSEKSVIKTFPKSHIGWLDDIPIYINKCFVGLSTQERILWILVVVVVYCILLVLIRYKNVYILFILSNIFVIYFIYNIVSGFKLIVAWNIILTIIISLIVIGLRLTGFEIIRDVIETIIEGISDGIFNTKLGTMKHNVNTESNYEEEKVNDNFKHDYFEYSKENYTNEQYIKSEDKTYKTPYEVLGVSKGDDIEIIKRVYKSLSKTYHPDINSSSLSNEKFIEINEAWEKIKKERGSK